MANCEYCAYMTKVALPDHKVEVWTQAAADADRFEVDRLGFLTYVDQELDDLDDHESIDGFWDQVIWVRARLSQFVGPDRLRELIALGR